MYALTNLAAQIVEAYQYDAYGQPTVFDPGPSGVVDFGAADVITPGRDRAPSATRSCSRG